MKKILIILILFVLTTSCSKLKIFGFGEEKDKFEKLKINKSLWISSNKLLKQVYSGYKNILGKSSLNAIIDKIDIIESRRRYSKIE